MNDLHQFAETIATEAAAIAMEGFRTGFKASKKADNTAAIATNSKESTILDFTFVKTLEKININNGFMK